MFNLNASESQRVGDVLAMTANSSTTDIRGLGESLKYAGLGANSFKMSLEETSAVLGVLGNRKIDSSCLLYTSPSPRDGLLSRMPSSA